jgi:hypothetical protein
MFLPLSRRRTDHRPASADPARSRIHRLHLHVVAQRELDARVSVVNNPTYRARPTATFRQLAERWQVKVLPNHADTTQRSEKSDIRALVAVLGDVAVKDINTERLQDMIAEWRGASAKTIRNRSRPFD